MTPDIFQNHFKAVLPEIFLITAITSILIYAVAFNPSPRYKFPIMTAGAAGLSVQALVTTVALFLNDATTSGTKTLFGNVLIADEITLLIKIIILLSALSSILISFGCARAAKGSAEHTILMLFSTFSMLFIVSSYDLISMYLAIELQSLCFYVIAASRRNNEFSVEAGLKYFILGALSSGLLLFGESIVYGFTGITNFEELSKFFLTLGFSFEGGAPIIGVFFIFVAFLFKIGAVPFHMWTPDVYEGAPTSVTAFFAITPKIAILALFLRLCYYTFWDLIASWQEIIIVCALLSTFVGTLGAINQNKIKRLFAYSSIAHVGYLLIALATGSIEAVESLLIYIIIYILMIINVFGILLVLSKAGKGLRPSVPLREGRFFVFVEAAAPEEEHGALLKQANPLWEIYAPERGSRAITGLTEIAPKGQHGQSSTASHLTDLSSLSKTNPLLAGTAAMIFFSNAGVPPLAGFYGKLNIFLAAVQGGMFFVALAGVVSSVMGAFYSIRLVKILYYHPNSSTELSRRAGTQRIWYKTMSKENSIILGITFFFTTLFVVYPSFLFTITHSAALSLV